MKKSFLTLALFIVISINGNVRAADKITADNPLDFADKVANKIVDIIESASTNAEKQQIMIDFFDIHVDTAWMSKFVLGRHYRKLEDDQKDKYQSLYRDLVVYTYIPRFREYAGEEINFYDSIDKGDGEYIVKSALKTPQAKGDILVDYRVRKDGNTYKILDIIGEGVSLITTQRSDFAAPISRKGMDFFLGRLEKKVESLKSKSFD